MTLYVKLINDTLIYPPTSTETVSNYNAESNYEMLLADGYKPLVRAERPQEEYYITYEETEDEIREVVHVLTPEEIAARERARLDKLTCTKRVFMLILEQMGVTYTQIKQLISQSKQAQMEWDLCVELLRGNPFLDQMAVQIGFTSEDLDNIFKIANGELFLNEQRFNEALSEES